MPSKLFGISPSVGPPISPQEMIVGILYRVEDSSYKNSIVTMIYGRTIVALWMPKSRRGGLDVPFNATWNFSPNYLVRKVGAKEKIVVTTSFFASEDPITMGSLRVGQLAHFHDTVITKIYGGTCIGLCGKNRFSSTWRELPDNEVYPTKEAVEIRQIDYNDNEENLWPWR